MALRTHVHREDLREEFRVVALTGVARDRPPRRDLRREGRGRPGVHDVGVADESACHASLFGVVAGRDVGLGVDRQGLFRGEDRVVVVGLALCIERVPDRERHPEEALSADQPVAVEPADPVGVAAAHERGVEVDLLATRDEFVLQLLAASAVADVPLPAGHDLERLVALLEEVGLALRLHRLTDQVAALAQGGDDRLAGRMHRFGRELLDIEGFSGAAGDPLRSLTADTAVARDDRTDGQLQFAPPHDVGEVTEGAAHRDARALVRLRRLVGEHRDLDTEQRGGDGGAEEVLVPLVVRVGDEGDDGRDEFRTGRLDLDRAAVRLVEAHLVERAGVVACFQLGLGDRGLEGDVPESGRLSLIGLVALDVAQEGLLCHGA